MSGAMLRIRRAGPQMSVQDLGRTGWLSKGLSRGGAADRRAIFEGAALLDQSETLAAIEMAGAGGAFEATAPIRIALTGAPMSAKVGDRALRWNASHRIAAGDVVEIGPAKSGIYGYLSVGGGIATEPVLGSRAAHLVAGIGARLEKGAELPVGEDPHPDMSAMVLDPQGRFQGGTVRALPGAQTAFYAEETRARFAETAFTRSPRGNRQGVKLDFEGDPFGAEGQRTILSEIIIPGDIQMTGEGAPFVLLPECQTTGGYPRIGSVLPEDLPIVAQAAPGTGIRFRILTADEADAAHRPEAEILREIRGKVRPLVRDPADIRDLAGYQLISGVTAGAPPEETEVN